jgi:sugar phosphate permease
MLWVLWLTYGSFYFCRSNLSAALPGIQSELGFTKADLGWVLASFKIAYAAGQIVNGQLAERVSARTLLAMGMFASAALSAIFGLGAGIGFWLFVWAANGYAQALGWTPTMRVASAWIPPAQRGLAFGILGTGYQVTAALTLVASGYAAEHWGWRAALWLPAIVFALCAVHMLVLLRERPPAPVVATSPDAAHADPRDTNAVAASLSFGETVVATLANGSLWLLAISLGLLNATRYGFLDWGLSHVKEMQATGVGSAALKYAILPLGGVIGALLSGWISDRFAGGRRAPIVCALLVVLAGLTVAYQSVVSVSTFAVVAVLFCVGVCVFGAQVLLVGAFPVDLARRGTSAAAVGLVNCMGYVGAALGDVLTGWLVDHHGWRVAIYAWAGYALVAATLMLPLWRRVARGTQLEVATPAPR